MESEVKEGTVKHRDLGTLKVFERDLKIGEVISSKVTNFLDSVIAMTSRGNRLSNKELLRTAIYWLLRTKKLQRIGLMLNGNSSDNYTIAVTYLKKQLKI